jgi:hypothetical protein
VRRSVCKIIHWILENPARYSATAKLSFKARKGAQRPPFLR